MPQDQEGACLGLSIEQSENSSAQSLQLAPRLIAAAQHLSGRLSEKEGALRQARRRVVELQRALDAQAQATRRAGRDVLAGRLKLLEAGHAMARARRARGARAASPSRGENQPAALSPGAASWATEKQAAKRARDSARAVVVQLQLRVELLGAQTGSGPGAVLGRAHARLASLLRRQATELALLEEDIRALRDDAAGAAPTSATSGPSSPRCPRPKLESRWIQLAVACDTVGGSPTSTEAFGSPISVTMDDLLLSVSVKNTKVWSTDLQQMLKDFDEILSLL